jgi:hypothetical protein
MQFRLVPLVYDDRAFNCRHDTLLPAALKALKLGGRIAISAATSDLELDLTLSGFVDVKASTEGVTVARRPAYAPGSATKIVLRKKATVPATNVPPPAPADDVMDAWASVLAGPAPALVSTGVAAAAVIDEVRVLMFSAAS